MTRPRRIPLDDWQYGDRSPEQVRATLLALTNDFVAQAQTCSGVRRIALIGSILTAKPRPKDVDLLVTITATVDMARLAKVSRRLKGSAQAQLNSGADVFLADGAGQYLGRVCHYRECYPRVLCRARHCGAVPHIADDLDVVNLDPDVIAAPPVELWPAIVARVALPHDVERLLIAPLRQSGAAPDNSV